MKDVVLVFDVDGTLEVGNPPGPIPLKTLLYLKEKDFIVGIVGSWDKIPERTLAKLDFHYPGHPEKPKWLSKVRERYSPTIVLYIADEERDRDACKRAGVTYVKPEDFRICTMKYKK